MNGCTATVRAFVDCISGVIINPILALIFAAGLLVFVFGIVEYIWGLSSDTDKKNTGKQHMLWGVIGMFIMVAAYGILKFVANTLNVSIPQ